MKKANVARRAMNNLPCVSSELSRLIGHKTDTRAHMYGFIRENSDERVKGANAPSLAGLCDLRVDSVHHIDNRSNLLDFYARIFTLED